MRIIAAMAIVGSLSVTPMLASAQTAPAPATAARPVPQPAAQPTPAVQPAPAPVTAEPEYTLSTAGGHRVYVMRDDVHVPGDIQRPYAFAVTGRSALGYTAFEDARSFLPDVTAVVRRDPF